MWSFRWTVLLRNRRESQHCSTGTVAAAPSSVAERRHEHGCSSGSPRPVSSRAAIPKREHENVENTVLGTPALLSLAPASTAPSPRGLEADAGGLAALSTAEEYLPPSWRPKPDACPS